MHQLPFVSRASICCALVHRVQTYPQADRQRCWELGVRRRLECTKRQGTNMSALLLSPLSKLSPSPTPCPDLLNTHHLQWPDLVFSVLGGKLHPQGTVQCRTGGQSPTAKATGLQRRWVWESSGKANAGCTRPRSACQGGQDRSPDFPIPLLPSGPSLQGASWRQAAAGTGGPKALPGLSF